jgi:hypothetical protein
MIDHVEISNEMQANFMLNTASVLTDVTSLVTNYGSTTTDHYPVFTRYAFDPVILPVNLVSFTVTKQQDAAILNWSTAQEHNSREFAIEKSTDSKNWTVIGTVTAAGNSDTRKSYSYTDHSPAPGVNYYRLKQVDLDGKFQYSFIRKISIDASPILSITPNPAKDLVNIHFVKNNSTVVNIEVVDIAGKVVQRQSSASSFIQLNVSKLSKGTYFIKVLNGNITGTQKLLVQ